MKRIFTILALSFVCVLSVIGFAACGGSDKTADTRNPEILGIYNTYVAYAEENGTTPLSYDEWLAQIKGEKGDKGEDGKDGINGQDGKNGIDGIDGINGKDGIGIKSAIIDESGNLILTMTDNNVIDAGKVKNVHPHEIIEKEVVEREPTCTRVGLKYVYCDTCGEILKTVIVEKTQHDYEDIITPPTCTEQGYTTHTCKDCGHVEKDTYTEPTGHSYTSEFTVDDNYHWNKPTCSHADAIVKVAHTLDKNGICTVCGYDEHTTLALQFVKINGKEEYAVSALSNDNIKTVYIPETYNNLPVTKINDGLFFNNKNVQKIVMSDNITEIGTSAFYGCEELQNIYLSNSLIRISDNLFKNCHSLISITIPNTVIDIGQSAFANCANLISITIIGDNLKSINDYAFYGCRNLTTIKIPNSVTSIGSMAFADCYSLTSFSIPNSVTSIGDRAFSCCSVVEINKGISYVDNWIIDCDSAITSVTIKDTVIGIADFAFNSCNVLTSIIISENITHIGWSAFRDCSSLKQVYYLSTAENWSKISIGDDNYTLTGAATRYYYSETEPTEEGNYWHYDTDGITPIIGVKEN